jgi:hypothetical protein
VPTGAGGRWVKSRTVTDETGAHTWNYTYNTGVSTPTITVTDPEGNCVVHSFSDSWPGGVSSTSLYETEAQYYAQCAGTPLKTVTTTYQASGASPNTNTDAAVMLPAAVTTSYPASSGSEEAEVMKQYDSGFSFTGFAGGSDSYNAAYGKVVAETDYDYGLGGPGGPLKKTVTGYLALSNSSYLTNNLLDLVSSVQIQSGSGGQTALASYGYDAPGLVPTNIQEQKVASPDNGAPGNQTSVSQWMSGSTVATTNCSSTVSNGNETTTKAIYDTGEVASATDPCGHATSFSYLTASPYYGAFFNSVTDPLGHTTTYGYDINTGVVTPVQNPNRQQVTNTMRCGGLPG